MQDILRNLPKESKTRRLWLAFFSLGCYFSLFTFVSDGSSINLEMLTILSPVSWLLVQAVFALFFFIGCGFFFSRLFFKYSVQDFVRRCSYQEVGVLFLLSICFMVSISPLTEWNMNIVFPDAKFESWARKSEDGLRAFMEYITHFESFGHFVLAFFVIAILAAIGEELLFRGLLQNVLDRLFKNAHIAIWISAILFGIVHMQFYGVIPRVLLGVLFGYLYFWSGNLAIPIIAHFINNAFAITVLYVVQLNGLEMKMMDEAAPWPAVLVCFGISFLMLSFLYRKYA